MLALENRRQSNIGNGTGGISQFDGGLFQAVLLYILVNRGSIQFFKDLLEPGNRNVMGRADLRWWCGWWYQK